MLNLVDICAQLSLSLKFIISEYTERMIKKIVKKKKNGGNLLYR